MKVIRFAHNNRIGVGLVQGDRVVDAGQRLGMTRIADLLTPQGRDRAASLLATGATDLPLAQVRLLEPYDNEARIFAIGINYKSHAAETGRDMPVRPSSFIRTQDSVVPTNTPIVRPVVSTHFDYEGELTAVIGKPAHRVKEADALDYVAGYTIFNDGSVRDYQKFSVTAGKNFDRSGACGPWIVLSDEIPDPTRLTLVTRLNGNEMQRSGTDMLIYSIPLIVSYLSEITTLRPGDLIATGTPGGVGSRRTPPVWMKAGDRIEIEISGIGTLSNTVVDEE
jgi:2-keto-4-pentenoate hydratase/2-oxohepta-3-ene-1,7-dioic acid hydratase in catechol pathway